MTCLLRTLIRSLLVVLSATAGIEAATITRGPYLQLQTTNSIVVRWRTDEPVRGWVHFGERSGELDRKATAAGAHTEHVVHVTGLRPGTRYYYTPAAGNAGRERILAEPDVDRFFETAPPVGIARKTRVWVVGDSGTADERARRVRDSFFEWNGSRTVDAWLMLGDNAYGSGTDDEYQRAVFETYPRELERIVLWPTLGNHDAAHASSATQSGVYYDIFTLPTRGQAGGLISGTEAYYSFDHANIHFICLDSHDSDRSPSGAMVSWLEHDLSVTTQEWIVAFFHHPPYTKGSHDSDNRRDSGGRLHEMRELVLPVLEAGGVDLVLSGHSHSYERSFLIDGHYGESDSVVPSMFKSRADGREHGTGAYRKPAEPTPHEGAVYVVAGSSGQTSGGRLNHPVMYLSLNELGSLCLDIDGSRLDASFIDDRGQRLDQFTMLKGVR